MCRRRRLYCVVDERELIISLVQLKKKSLQKQSLDELEIMGMNSHSL
jgi:hypothetical protein